MLSWVRQWWMNKRLSKARDKLNIDIQSDTKGIINLPVIEPYSLGYRPVQGEVLHGHHKLKDADLFITNKAFAVQGEQSFRKG